MTDTVKLEDCLRGISEKLNLIVDENVFLKQQLAKMMDIISGSDKESEPAKNEMMSAQEAAKYLGVSMSSIYKMTSSGKIKFFKPGGGLKFRKEDLDEHIARSVSVTEADMDKAAEEYLRKNPTSAVWK